MTAPLGPISSVLEAEVREKVRNHGIVVWLDPNGYFNEFVDTLVGMRADGELPYEVRAYRGSHLELILQLEPLAGGADRPRLLVHLPGYNENTVRSTPMLELYEAGTSYRKALDTLVADAAGGRVQPERIAAFRVQDDVTLETADAWLESLLGDEGGLSSQLGTMRPVAVLDDLISGGPLADRLVHPEDLAAIWDRVGAWTGLPASRRELSLSPTGRRASDLRSAEPRAEAVAFAIASWALCVEYVDDLKRDPVDARLLAAMGLPRPTIDICREIASHLRERHLSLYEQAADETEISLADEVRAARAEDLGKIDTFRFEEDRVLEAALQALADENWIAALEWASLRLDGRSFWLNVDPVRQSTWQLVQAAAELGRAIADAGASLGVSHGLEQAVDRYVERGAPVDRAHRHLEQRRTALLYPQVPEFETLRTRLDGMRVLWRVWADTWTREFNLLCRAEGFLPESAMQQRTLFDEVVQPLATEPGTTALFLVDALRYEMGSELYDLLSDTPSTTAHLKARLAELPTVTEVGMNVLAPVSDRGRLRPAMASGSIIGFSVGQFRVSDPETRKRRMQERVGGHTCPWLTLEEVVSRDAVSLKQAVARARLVIVHSQEIDNAGEKGVGPAVFDVVMQKLRAAWRLLRDAGVRRFVITADHGFLLLDETAGTAQPHGRKVDPKRRHVFSPVAADHTGEARVPLAELGYEGVEGHLMFPETTAVFDTGRRSISFVHGGNSLQERVIPVLTLSHRAASGTSTLRYQIVATAKDGVAGMHCVDAMVTVAEQESFEFGGSREIELALRSPDTPDVQVELVQTRGGARIAGGLLVATVGVPFELFFRLAGAADARVRVELLRSTAEFDVVPCIVDGRFPVTAGRATPTVSQAVSGRDWLDDMPSPEVRQLFAHLAAHGAVTESEASIMLGGQRALRRFAVRFEELAAKAPFPVRIDVVAGVKRYVREGTG